MLAFIAGYSHRDFIVFAILRFTLLLFSFLFLFFVMFAAHHVASARRGGKASTSHHASTSHIAAARQLRCGSVVSFVFIKIELMSRLK